MHFLSIFGSLLLASRALSASLAIREAPNSTYTNPVLTGWHSDPSCTYVSDSWDAYFCVFSTFLAFPGLPIYASKDLINWRLASYAFSDPSQVPWIATAEGQQEGIFAPTIRYRDGVFYVVTTYTTPGDIGLLFRTKDPYHTEAWTGPLNFDIETVDPDLFWDDDGTLYVTFGGCCQMTLDPETGETSEPYDVWLGTGGQWPEGPHIHKRPDGKYYLIISEGGTNKDHMVTVARAPHPAGPYEAYEHNPILTNANTTEYFQAVGHSDVFKAPDGHYWGVALAKRTGPANVAFPMGREMVMFPVSWDDEWPRMQPVRGRMQGWPLPPQTRDAPGIGPFNEDPDDLEFRSDSSLPPHYIHWRFPDVYKYQIVPAGRKHVLQLTSSVGNITSSPPKIPYTVPFTFLARRQTSTLFRFIVDLSISALDIEGAEGGISLFLTQRQHADIGIVTLPDSNGDLAPHFRFRAIAVPARSDLPADKIVPVPKKWLCGPIQLQIRAISEIDYEFSASSKNGHDDAIILGTAPSWLISGSPGSFVGGPLGMYATTNGADGEVKADISRIQYIPEGQYTGDGEWVYP